MKHPETLRRLLYIPVLHIDTNLINARQKLSAVNKLEEWYENGVISINISSTALGEAKAGNNESRTRKSNQQIFTTTTPTNHHDPMFQKVSVAIFPDGVTDQNQENDIKIICEAIKYHAILVTSDGGSKSQPGGILGNRSKISQFVQIMSPEEAVVFVRNKIDERDQFNQELFKEFGCDLPEWSGLD